MTTFFSFILDYLQLLFGVILWMIAKPASYLLVPSRALWVISLLLILGIGYMYYRSRDMRWLYTICGVVLYMLVIVYYPVVILKGAHKEFDFFRSSYINEELETFDDQDRSFSFSYPRDYSVIENDVGHISVLNSDGNVIAEFLGYENDSIYVDTRGYKLQTATLPYGSCKMQYEVLQSGSDEGFMQFSLTSPGVCIGVKTGNKQKARYEYMMTSPLGKGWGLMKIGNKSTELLHIQGNTHTVSVQVYDDYMFSSTLLKTMRVD